MKLRPGVEEAMHPTVRAIIGRQEPGAWPLGSRVRKLTSNESDTHPPGAMATIRGSCGPFTSDAGGPPSMVYVVEWDDLPGVPVLVAAVTAKGPRLGLVAEGVRAS